MSPSKFKPLLRYLTIGWMVFWLLACILLIVLWVSSYQQLHVLRRLGPNPLLMNCSSGVLQIAILPSEARPGRKPSWTWSYHRVPNESTNVKSVWYFDGSQTIVNFPVWIVVVVVGLAAMLPWTPSRFSLRTLLIFTSLIAVVLRIIVWVVRT